MAIRIKKGTQITFDAADDAEALRTARDRLGPDAVILSSPRLKTGGFLGFFRKTVLRVTAAVLEEEARQETDSEKRERLAAFQKLLELKQAMASPGEGVTGGEASLLNGTGFRGGPQPSPGGVYTPRPARPGKTSPGNRRLPRRGRAFRTGACPCLGKKGRPGRTGCFRKAGRTARTGRRANHRRQAAGRSKRNCKAA